MTNRELSTFKCSVLSAFIHQRDVFCQLMGEWVVLKITSVRENPKEYCEKYNQSEVEVKGILPDGRILEFRSKADSDISTELPLDSIKFELKMKDVFPEYENC